MSKRMVRKILRTQRYNSLTCMQSYGATYAPNVHIEEMSAILVSFCFCKLTHFQIATNEKHFRNMSPRGFNRSVVQNYKLFRNEQTLRWDIACENKARPKYKREDREFNEF